jgi:16S rRNA (uracil1498-N3)-methyltransferase
MLTPRIFVGGEAPSPAPGTDYALPPAAARRVAQALRMRAGDAVALFTGCGGEFATTIRRIERRDVVVRVERHDAIERESPWPVLLAQGIIAADMMDFVVRKAVELGVAAIVPLVCARSQAAPAERIVRRATHWRQVAIAACEQCGRNRVPDVRPAVTFTDFVATIDNDGGPASILDAGADVSLAQAATTRAPRTLAIGPEGGFTEPELRAARARGATRVHLGPRVLRAETAALAALATLNAVAGDAR